MCKVNPAHALSSPSHKGNLSPSPLADSPPAPSPPDALDAHASPMGHRRCHTGPGEAHPGRYALVGRLANAIVTLLRRHGIDRPVQTWHVLRDQFQTDVSAARVTLESLGLPEAVEARVANVASVYACDDVVRPDVRRAYEAAVARHVHFLLD